MQNLLTRALLGLIGAVSAWPGIWATLYPRGFYDNFPGFGMQLVAVDGPYNEHLVRDVGAFFLAMTVLAIGAIVLRTMVVARLAAVVILAFAIPHALYHLRNLHVYPALDATVNVIGLALFIVVPIVVLVLPARTIPEEPEKLRPGT